MSKIVFLLLLVLSILVLVGGMEERIPREKLERVRKLQENLRMAEDLGREKKKITQLRQSGAQGRPAVWIPGIGGSVLQAKLNKTHVPHFYCTQHTTSYYQIWLALSDLIPGKF